MSELPAGHPTHSTEDILHQIQADLLPFAARPERFPFASYDADQHLVACGNLGSIMLAYNRRNQSQVSFTADEGFAVSTTYRLHTGIYVSPLALDEIPALEVRYTGPDNPSYWPRHWPDGGCSLRNSAGENLDVATVWHIGQVVGQLAAAFTQPDGTRLGLVE